MDFKKESLDTILNDEKNECKVELVVRQEPQNDEDSIDLWQLWQKIVQGKSYIALITVGAILLSIIVGVGYLLVGTDYKGTASTIISFNYDGIDKGLDPHGKSFDISEIKSSEVLHKTIEELELSKIKVTVDDLKRNISISGIMPNDIMDQVLIINKMAEKDVSKLEQLNELDYYPVEYKIDFKIPKKLKLNSAKAKEILDAVISNYKEYFVEKYSDRQVLNTAVSAVDFNKYDYPEYVMLASGQISTIKNYLELKSNKAPDFRAVSTQMTFGDLLAQFELLENVDLNRIQALINSFNLTKDAVKLEAIYQNRVVQMDIKVKQKEDESLSTRQQADTYKKDTNVLLMPGGTAGTDSFEMTQNSRTYDNLVEQSTSAANEAIRLKYEIEYYDTLIAKLKNLGQADAEAPLNNIDKETYMKDVEVQIEDLSKNMKKFVDLTNLTVDDYFETEVFKDAVKINVGSVFASTFRESLKTVAMLMIAITFLGFMIGVFITLLKNNTNTHLKSEKQ